MFVRAGRRDNTTMVIFGEDGKYHFPLYWTIDLVAINGSNHDYLIFIEMEYMEVLEAFVFVIYCVMVELDRRNDYEKKIDEYLRKFGFI